MASSSAGAVLRGDLNGMIEEADERESMLIGNMAAPEWGVNTKDGQYPVFKKQAGLLLKNAANIRRPTGTYPEIKRQYENDNFSCVDRGLEEAVDDSEKSDVMRFFDAEMVAARQVKYNVMIGHEVRVGALFFTEGIWGTDQDASANWDVKATDIPLDFMTAFNSLNTVGEIPNTVIVGQDVFTQMSTNTEMQNFIRGNRPTDSRLDITAQMVAEAFAGHGIRQVLIGRASFDSADEGLTPVLTPAWPVDFAWVGRIGTGQPLGGGAARTFVWNQEGGLFVTESYREEKRRSEIVRVRQNTAEKVLDVNAGVLIDTRVA